jgi:hypothetical protein
VAATIWVRFPYQRWLASHRWMGVPYILTRPSISSSRRP